MPESGDPPKVTNIKDRRSRRLQQRQVPPSKSASTAIPPRERRSRREATLGGSSKSRLTLWQRLFGPATRSSTSVGQTGKSKPQLVSNNNGTASQSPSPLMHPTSQRFRSVERLSRRNGLDRPALALPPTSRANRRSRRSSSRPVPLNGASEINRVNPAAYRQPSRPLEMDLNGASAARRTARPIKKRFSPLLYATRLVILGIGIGAIAGTLLAVGDPATRYSAKTADSKQAIQRSGMVVSKDANGNPLPAGLKLVASPLKPTQEVAALKTEVQKLAAQNTGLTLSAFLIDLDTGAFVDINGTTTLSAASTIKVPVLVAFFQDVDAGKIRLDEKLTMRPDLIGGGSGDMQYQPPGTQFSALETASQMIITSDNTATNMLIDRLGGIAALNQRFQAWGLPATVLRNPLPDLQGTNTTSAKDLVNMMALIDEGELVSLRSRDRMLDIMRQTLTDTLLPPGLGEGATIAHKTGDIGSLVGDIGLVDMPNGKRYLVAAMVKRPFNDPRAQELIRQTSRAVYKHLSQPPAPPSPAPTQAAVPQKPGNQAIAPGNPSAAPNPPQAQ